MPLNADNMLRNQTVEAHGAKEGKTGCKDYEKHQRVKRKVHITATDRKFLPHIILYRNMTLMYGMFYENFIAYAQRT
jgi:hypothetical protein